MTTTVDSLLMAADTLHGLPGLPPVTVTAHGCAVTFTVHGADAGGCDDDNARAFAVDALAAVLGLTPEAWAVKGVPWYRASGDVGDFRIDIYGPQLEVVVPA